MLITSDVAGADLEDAAQSRAWWRGLLVPKVLVGLVIVLFFAALAIFGPMLDHVDPGAVTRTTLRPPSLHHWLGTTQQGQDVAAQLIYGARVSLEVGFGAGILTTLWSVIVGLSGGYIAGVGSELLSMFSNVFLVIPSLPLVVILAAYLPNSGATGIIVVITVTGWAWGARVLRAQTLSLRRRDFVEAARATGENSFKIMLYDILPNELAIITATFLASVVGAILTEASIAFLGLSNVTQWSWGTMLYWAQVSGAELSRAWWWFVPPGLAIALVGTGLAFVNFGIDDVINPRLRSTPSAARHRPRVVALAQLLAHPRAARPASSGSPRPDSAVLAGRRYAAREGGRTQPAVPLESAPGSTVLEIRNLKIEYQTAPNPVHAVNDVSLTLHRGEVLGIAGESGSGKSTLARAITRLLRPPAEITAGEMLYTDRSGRQRNIVDLSDRDLRQFRWEEISIVFQSAMNALNPILTLGIQLDDVLAAHRPGMRKPQRVARIRELLQLVGISPDRAGAYPHELSGGMRQRAMIAMGLALDPEIIVMDEPTTALDVVIQRQVIETISSLKERLGFSVIFITHDLSLLIELCDTIAIMYAGRIVELAPAAQLYAHPLHPYSQGLLASFPTLTGPRRTLTGVPGYPPDMRRHPPGCPFQPRCPHSKDACTTTLPLLTPHPARGGAPEGERREQESVLAGSALHSGQPSEVACLLYDPQPASTSPAAPEAARSDQGLQAGGPRA